MLSSLDATSANVCYMLIAITITVKFIFTWNRMNKMQLMSWWSFLPEWEAINHTELIIRNNLRMGAFIIYDLLQWWSLESDQNVSPCFIQTVYWNDELRSHAKLWSEWIHFCLYTMCDTCHTRMLLSYHFALDRINAPTSHAYDLQFVLQNRLLFHSFRQSSNYNENSHVCTGIKIKSRRANIRFLI